MKKKIIIIIALVFAFLFAFWLYTDYVDSARVRNSVEPKFTIKIVSDDGNKVTYFGLGYKVIRYPSVSPNEPFKNARGIKMGNWFMEYDVSDIEPDNNISEIVDKTLLENIPTDMSLYPFYEDDNYVYFNSRIKNDYIIVKFKDGTETTAEIALKDGKITIKDLDDWKIQYIKQEKE